MRLSMTLTLVGTSRCDVRPGARHGRRSAPSLPSSRSRFTFSLNSTISAGAALGLALLSSACSSTGTERPIVVSKWEVFERKFTSRAEYTNAPQEAEMRVVFTSPSGESRSVFGFWDGGRDWKVRFAPDEAGHWYYSTSCSDRSNAGLHLQEGSFYCMSASLRTRFDAHGPITVARDGTHFIHQDSTPFFWLADANWNGPLRSLPSEWEDYVAERAAQGFTAIQWVATQWPGSPDGDRFGIDAFSGDDKIKIYPEFFSRLDEKIVAMNRAGLLSVPILLWVGRNGTNTAGGPGFSLQEDQAILLARYMVARWGAYATSWILAGNGDFLGPKAERWKRIGNAVFGSAPRGPVTLYPAEKQWLPEDFGAERWLTFVGYQGGPSASQEDAQWLSTGPLAKDWSRQPPRPIVNLGTPLTSIPGDPREAPRLARRGLYWSLLGAPIAGFTRDGGIQFTSEARRGNDHEIPLDSLAHLIELLGSIDFRKLRPAPELLASQPGLEEPSRFIAASRTADGNLAVIYLNDERSVSVRQRLLPPNFTASWFNPRTGEVSSVVATANDPTVQFATPTGGDWVLVLKGRP